MGVIRPQKDANDGAGRWSIVFDGDEHLIGTRSGILAAHERLSTAGIGHQVYRRPGLDFDWQLAGSTEPWQPARGAAIP